MYPPILFFAFALRHTAHPLLGNGVCPSKTIVAKKGAEIDASLML